MQYGIDPKRIYKRQTLDVDFKLINCGHVDNMEYIGFCGVVYPFKHYIITDVTQVKPLVYIWYAEPWAWELVTKFKPGTSRKKLVWQLADKDSKAYRLPSQYAKEWMETTIKSLTPLFMKLQVPIFHVHPPVGKDRGYVVTINPPLRPLQFYRVKDALAAWRELEAYVGGPLAQESPPPVEVADKLRVAAHGFDERSFRRQQHPGKPRGGNKKL